MNAALIMAEGHCNILSSYLEEARCKFKFMSRFEKLVSTIRCPILSVQYFG